MKKETYSRAVVVLLVLVFVFSACASSKTLETYEENLSSDYKITKFYGDKLESAFTDDIKKYGHDGALVAIGEDLEVLVIHQFNSVSNAKKYVEDNQDVEMLVVRDGKFVLLSDHKEVINEALGK